MFREDERYYKPCIGRQMLSHLQFIKQRNCNLYTILSKIRTRNKFIGNVLRNLFSIKRTSLRRRVLASTQSSTEVTFFFFNKNNSMEQVDSEFFRISITT